MIDDESNCYLSEHVGHGPHRLLNPLGARFQLILPPILNCAEYFLDSLGDHVGVTNDIFGEDSGSRRKTGPVVGGAGVTGHRSGLRSLRPWTLSRFVHAVRSGSGVLVPHGNQRRML